MEDIVIVAAARTAVGKFGGALAKTPATELGVEVVATHPHDPEAFTQGLEIDEGELLEGTGRAGRSWVSACGPRTRGCGT